MESFTPWRRGDADRIARGGSWASRAGHCRSAFRRRPAPSSRLYNLGTRVVRTIP